jgi:hypothetical protein
MIRENLLFGIPVVIAFGEEQAEEARRKNCIVGCF